MIIFSVHAPPDLSLQHFWRWTAFEDYLLFCFGFTVLCAVVTLLLLDSALFVETLGSLAVMFEAMLGLPQLLQNLQNRSTRGMRYAALKQRSNTVTRRPLGSHRAPLSHRY